MPQRYHESGDAQVVFRCEITMNQPVRSAGRPISPALPAALCPRGKQPTPFRIAKPIRSLRKGIWPWPFGPILPAGRKQVNPHFQGPPPHGKSADLPLRQAPDTERRKAPPDGRAFPLSPCGSRILTTGFLQYQILLFERHPFGHLDRDPDLFAGQGPRHHRTDQQHHPGGREGYGEAAELGVECSG